VMFKKILPANAIRNIWRIVRRICILILGLKGLIVYIAMASGNHFHGI